MFVGYPYSHEDLEKIDAEIKKNREEHPEYGSITRTIAAVIGLIIWSIFWLITSIVIVFWLF